MVEPIKHASHAAPIKQPSINEANKIAKMQAGASEANKVATELFKYKSGTAPATDAIVRSMPHLAVGETSGPKRVQIPGAFTGPSKIRGQITVVKRQG